MPDAAVPSADDALRRALSLLSTEMFDGPPRQHAYMLNPGDRGLLRQLESLDAATASARPIGQTTVAAHVDHVRYGLDLLNRAAAGEANPWQSADWTASWRRTELTDAAWRDLLTRLRATATLWQANVRRWSDWSDVAAPGVLSSLAHTMYHLGAIRQILAAQGKHSDRAG
ncbi:MAG TPA: hypothetical protein VGN72_12030 [Tepidisphaeraceae bacterium]|jgi:hypothetical protein|nr:hypothetical protein [Tepidisphaeraceae bacterium]